MPFEPPTSESPAAYAPRAGQPAEEPVQEVPPEEDSFESKPVRPGRFRPLVSLVAWLMTLGAGVGGMYVLFDSLRDKPAPASASTSEVPELEPAPVDHLIAVLGGGRSADKRVPGKAPSEEGGTRSDGPDATPIAPIPGVSLDWDGPAPDNDPALTDEKAAASLTLQGYVFAGDKRCAINGRLYREGDRVGRFTVGEIGEGGVTIRNGSFTTVLRPGR